jgi:hypothetical protein
MVITLSHQKVKILAELSEGLIPFLEEDLGKIGVSKFGLFDLDTCK